MHIQNSSQKVWREGHFFPDLDLYGSVLLECILGQGMVFMCGQDSCG